MVAKRFTATAILLTLFLMEPLAQFGAVEANSPFDDPTMQIDFSFDIPSFFQETSIPIEVRVLPWGSNRTFVDIYYTLDDGPETPLNIFRLETSSGIFGKGTLDNLTEGNHTLKAYSTDTQANTISYSTTFLVNTTITFPTFLLSPINTTYYSKEIPFTYTLDDSKYHNNYRIDNYGIYRLDGNTTLPELSEGQHTITAVAYDLNGVLYSKQRIKFTIDTTSPTPTSTTEPIPTLTPSSEPQLGQEVILGVAVTMAVLAVGLGLLVYLIKRK